MNRNNRNATVKWLSRTLVLAAVVGLFVLPLSAGAANIYFCSASLSQGGNGSATAPWACAEEAQLEAVLNTVCTNGGGTLYRSLSDSFVTYDVQPVEDGSCSVTSEISPGQPPTAGGDSPLTLLLIGAGLVGVAALVVGLALRLRPTRP